MNDELGSFVLANELSCPRIHRLCRAAHREQVSSIADLAKAGNWGRAPKNLSRDFMRHFLKGCDAPKLYKADIPVWDPIQAAPSTAQLSFLPTPEILQYLLKKDDEFRAMLSVPADMPELRQVMAHAEAKMGISGAGCLGLHADGVPYLKKESLEMFHGTHQGIRQWLVYQSQLYRPNTCASVVATGITPSTRFCKWLHGWPAHVPLGRQLHMTIWGKL